MTNQINCKIEQLTRRLRSLESAVVAFSGGVDSSVLLAVAREALGERMIAVTAVSPSLPECDRKVVEEFCARHGARHRYVETSEMSDPDYSSNPENRCYFCKMHLLSTLSGIADELGFKYVVEGTNESDLTGHRPGQRASSESERVVTPLIEVGFTKSDVRDAARLLGLATAEKPAAACLASRVPTGVRITSELLRRIDKAEDAIRAVGAKQVRVRHHGDLARIEIGRDDMGSCLERGEEIVERLKELGWKFVTIDLSGYRTGGMRE